MRKYLLALAIACSLCGAANAAIVTFGYTAVVTIAATDGPGGFNWGSAQFDGNTVVTGNTVRGMLSYDTATPTWLQPRPGVQLYRGGFGEFSLNVLENGFSFQSTSTDYPQLQVGNNSAQYHGSTDWFAFSSYKYETDDLPVYSASFSLFDRADTAFDSMALPSNLDLSLFEQHTVVLDFDRAGAWAQFTADLLTLERVNEVPEPATAATVMAGLTLLAFVRRASRRIPTK
jgi:hypothetical protein